MDPTTSQWEAGLNSIGNQSLVRKGLLNCGKPILLLVEPGLGSWAQEANFEAVFDAAVGWELADLGLVPAQELA